MAYQQPYQQQPQYAYPARRTSQLAVWSMVVGLVSGLLLLTRMVQGFGFAGCAVAVGLGIGGLVAIRRDPYRALTGRGMAVIGIVAGGAFLLLALTLYAQIAAGH